MDEVEGMEYSPNYSVLKQIQILDPKNYNDQNEFVYHEDKHSEKIKREPNYRFMNSDIVQIEEIQEGLNEDDEESF